MAVEVILPKIDQDMRDGLLVEWRKKEGEWVEKDEILYVLESEKITVEIEAPASGFLSRVTAKEGDTVPVGTVIALIITSDERSYS